MPSLPHVWDGHKDAKVATGMDCDLQRGRRVAVDDTAAIVYVTA
jgi:hypothetical protein